MTPLIKNCRYIDTREGTERTLVRFNDKALVFNGGYTIGIEEFTEFFVVKDA